MIVMRIILNYTRIKVDRFRSHALSLDFALLDLIIIETIDRIVHLRYIVIGRDLPHTTKNASIALIDTSSAREMYRKLGTIRGMCFPSE